MIVGATFGSRRGAENALPAFEKVYDVTKEGDNVNYDYITLEPESNYLVVRSAWTISTGKFYGHGMILITTPDSTAFGTVAASYNNFANSSNTGITISYPATGQIQWRCGGTAYRVRVRVYKIN